MTFTLLKLLQAGPPPPNVVLLPDEMFFTRAVSVAPGSDFAAVSAQVELALETLSPFPPAQLYHGFFWQAGSERALIYAAYRRRFTSEQTEEWAAAELVLPTFAALLGGDAKGDTTVVIPSESGLTAIYYDAGSIPAKISFEPIGADATDEDRAKVRDVLLAAVPNNRAVVLAAPPAPVTSRNEREFAFRAEGFTSRIPAARAAALDVRDKAELAGLRRSRQRDLILWRGFLGLVAAMLGLGLAEFGLTGIRMWDKTRLKQANAQQPVVDRIDMAQMLTTRVDELSTKRLLPIEMILFVAGTRPEAVRFLRTTTEGVYGLRVEAQSTSPAAVTEYRSKLAALPELERVEFGRPEARENGQAFTMSITFRPGALKPNAPAR